MTKKTNQSYTFRNLLQKQGWLGPTTVTVDPEGTITEIELASEGTNAQPVPGWLIPGFQNAHSHAFQYAMAGTAEHLQNKNDDFWSWRTAMYKTAASMDPDKLQAVAGMLYGEMLRHGITHVCEFHYLHHDKDGNLYPEIAEMSARILAAAKSVGMAITILPVLYQQGGFNQAAGENQKRFITKNIHDYEKILNHIQSECQSSISAHWGIALHSLRAVEKESIEKAVALAGSNPIHIHIAEQLKEVEDCVHHTGEEPVDWLLKNFAISPQWNLVHATHMKQETAHKLANTGSSVIICPQTEGNLGDGVFPLDQFRSSGGKVAIGSDSHIGLSPLEDLRWLDYVQRLQMKKRNVVCQELEQDSGMVLLTESWETGRRAATGHVDADFFEIGSPLTGIVLDPNSPIFIGKPQNRIISCLIYSGDPRCILSVIQKGEAVVSGGIHHNQERLQDVYRDSMK